MKPRKNPLLFVLLLFCLLSFAPTSFATPTTPTSDFIDNGDGTVTHKLTGLVWMRCAMGQTWDKATASCLGTAQAYAWDAAMALKSSFAGKSDWRLPNAWELNTIVERENYNPAINTTIFPNITNSLTNDFISSSSSSGDDSTAWLISFNDGYGSLYYKNRGYSVRLVRDGLSFGSFTTPTSDFIDNQDGTVTHKRTGLTWQRCAVGQIWSGTTCSGTPSLYDWNAAITLTSNLAGHNDWRIPNQNELLSIVEYGSYHPAINTIIFPNTDINTTFWSSSSFINGYGEWAVSISLGYSSGNNKSSGVAIRLVRGNWSTNLQTKITSITPTQAIIGKPTVFTVKGTNLNPNMGFTVADCQYSNVALIGGTAQQQRFLCTQFGKAGTKRGLIKTQPSGTLLKTFNIQATTAAPTSQTAVLTGQINIGALAGNNVLLTSGDESTDACLTDAVGKFRCLVPQNWTGTLIPQAKGVSFSPALLYVQNANGEKSLNNALSKVAFNGTSADSFPAGGVISSEWKKLATDHALWKLSMANGEVDDLTAYEGRFSLRSAKIAANQNSAIQTSINVTQAGNVSFARRVSSNAGHGILIFYIDGVLQGAWSGELGWDTQSYPLTAGKHTLRWEYQKDAEAAMGKDAAWLDAVSYPNAVNALQSTGSTQKIACEGVTLGLIAQMKVTATCRQLQAYLAWLRYVKPKRGAEITALNNNVKGIESNNELAQNTIEAGGKLFALGNIMRISNLSEKAISATSELGSNLIGTQCDTINDNVEKQACDNAKTATLSLLEFGFTQAMQGKGSVNVYPYAIEKSFSLGANIWFSLSLDSNTEKVNSLIIANGILDEYYLSGMSFDVMCKNYGQICSVLNDTLIDVFANSKGYRNDWWGAEYVNDIVISSVNSGIIQHNAAFNKVFGK